MRGSFPARGKVGHECREGGFALGRDRADPFSGVHIFLHDHETDRFIDITAEKDDFVRGVEDKATQAYRGKQHGIHERDLEDGAGGRVARGHPTRGHPDCRR